MYYQIMKSTYQSTLFEKEFSNWSEDANHFNSLMKQNKVTDSYLTDSYLYFETIDTQNDTTISYELINTVLVGFEC